MTYEAWFRTGRELQPSKTCVWPSILLCTFSLWKERSLLKLTQAALHCWCIKPQCIPAWCQGVYLVSLDEMWWAMTKQWHLMSWGQQQAATFTKQNPLDFFKFVTQVKTVSVFPNWFTSNWIFLLTQYAMDHFQTFILVLYEYSYSCTLYQEE